MTYDKYVEKVRRGISRIKWLKKHRLPLGAVGMALVGAVAVFIVCLGLFLDGAYADSIVYGETPKYGARAFLCRAEYLFADVTGSEPTENVPRAAGEYTLLAKTKNPFGQIRTSSCGFVIEKRKITVSVGDSSPCYGDRIDPDTVSVTASDLADGDRLTDVLLDLPEYATEDRTIGILSFRILSADGRDMTSSYDVNTEKGRLSVLARPLEITASSAKRSTTDCRSYRRHGR